MCAQTYPNWRFVHADVNHPYYNNVVGEHSPESYPLPFDAESFDLVIANSLFTHLRPQVVAHYLQEVARLLSPVGVAWLTFYVASIATERFQHQAAGYLTSDSNMHESAIAFTTKDAKALLLGSGLDLQSFIPGTWLTGAKQRRNQHEQDCFVLRRKLA